MDSAISLCSGPLLHAGKFAPFPHRRRTFSHKNASFPIPISKNLTFSVLRTTAAAQRSAAHARSSPQTCPVADKLKSVAGTLILTAAALLASRLAFPPAARAAIAVAPSPLEERLDGEVENGSKLSPLDLSRFLDSNSEAIDALRSLVYRKLELGEDAEVLVILERLMAARPDEMEWKYLAGRLLNEMGRLEDARKMFDETLEKDPLSFEALFENSVLMDRCGDGGGAMERLGKALEVAREEKKEKEARDVRLIMAQMLFLQKKVDEALISYEELATEDPKDYRPYFCQGVIYTLMDRNAEAREKFAKYKELSPKKFDVEGFMQTPLSRIKLFSTSNSDD